jgi:hypothetical protein
MRIIRNVVAFGNTGGSQRDVSGVRIEQVGGDVSFDVYDPIDQRIYHFTRTEFERLSSRGEGGARHHGAGNGRTDPYGAGNDGRGGGGGGRSY